MILVKSLLAGVAALIVYVLLVTFVAWLLTPNEGIGWIPILPILIGAALFFAAAFYWTFRRG